MIRRALPALVAAASVSLVSMLSFITSLVISVVGSQSRYPEAMADYIMPAVGGALQMWLGPLLLLGAVVFVAFWVILPVTAASRVGAVVAKTITTAVLATLAVGVLVFGRVTEGYPGLDLSRQLAQSLVDAGTTTGQAFIVSTPLIVLAGVFLWVWHRRSGLTESPAVE